MKQKGEDRLVVKNGSEGRAVEVIDGAQSKYALMRMDVGAMREVIQANVGAGGLTVSDLDRVKVPAGGGRSWEIPSLDGLIDEKELIGVVIQWSDRRAFWPEKFSGEGTPPQCSSDDGVTGRGDPGGACEVCPLAEFGTARDEKGQPARGQACKAIRQVFVAREGGGLLPVMLNLPPTSIAPLRKYFLRLASEQLPYWMVVTKLTLEKTRSGSGIEYSRVDASMVRRLSPEEVVGVEAYRNAIRPALGRVAVEVADFREAGS